MENAKYRKILARNIRYYMALKGVSRKEAAKALGISYTTFQDWHNAKVYPKMASIEKLADYFGCEMKDLMEDRIGKPTLFGDLSERQEALMEFARTVPDEKAEMMLRVMQSILAND